MASIMKKVSDIVDLVNRGKEREACLYVRTSPELYSKLPRSLRDNDQIALAAIGRMPSALSAATPRLKADLDFFVKVFSSYFNRQFSFSSAQDIFFMLQFAKDRHGYRHDIGSKQVAEKLSKESLDASFNTVSGALYLLVQRFDSWLSTDKEHDINTLRQQAPGFSDTSYEYAYDWAFSLRSSSQGDWRF